jgi:hypothetical protein
MRNHSQDSFDGGRAASLTTQEITPENETRNTRRQRPKTGPDDDLALALAMLALTEGGDL